MEPGVVPVTQEEVLGDERVRLPRLRETEPRRRTTWKLRHRGRWTALSLVLVAIAAGVAVDAGLRSHEGAAVSRCENQLRVATGYAERRLGPVSDYLQPVLRPSGRVQQIHLADLMAARAGRVLPRVQRADRFCDGVSVSPWHFSLVERQGAATAYSAALVSVVQTVAAQGHLPFQDDATLQRLEDELGMGEG
jgi:hypothetical protein